TFEEPTRSVLLPDPFEEPFYQPNLTIVLELNDLLVKPEWNYSSGLRFKKRPGVDLLIKELGYPNSELIIFTTDNFNSNEIIHALDSQGKFIYRLFKDSTRLENGEYIKDIKLMNRDPSKIVFIDCNAESCKYQNENSLILKPWDGNMDDTQIFDLAAFLK
ncbi:MAG: Mitochondrial import inner membrane translocase subunit TIM50, partial [Paramarteilia canceri]